MTLRSTVFMVQPSAETTLPKTMGRAVWACVLGLIGSREPDMAAALHDDHGLKPAAASPLQGPFTVEGDRLRLHLGQDYWFRVSSDARQHPWAHRQSYDDLYTATWQEAVGAAPLLALEFVSPTAFLSQGRAVLWPEPHRVFGSLLQRWQAFAPALLPGDLELEDAFAACLDVDAYDLQTRVQRYAKGAGRQVWYQKGFVGTCCYRAQRGTPEAVLRVAHLLACYALFAGVGSRTTVGMGQVRQVAGRR